MPQSVGMHAQHLKSAHTQALAGCGAAQGSRTQRDAGRATNGIERSTASGASPVPHHRYSSSRVRKRSRISCTWEEGRIRQGARRRGCSQPTRPAAQSPVLREAAAAGAQRRRQLARVAHAVARLSSHCARPAQILAQAGTWARAVVRPSLLASPPPPPRARARTSSSALNLDLSAASPSAGSSNFWELHPVTLVGVRRFEDVSTGAERASAQLSEQEEGNRCDSPRLSQLPPQVGQDAPSTGPYPSLRMWGGRVLRASTAYKRTSACTAGRPAAP
mgnify:CR=1 FL=1